MRRLLSIAQFGGSMGTEIVFVLIVPIALLCLPAAVLFWSGIAKMEQAAQGGILIAFLPLIVGFAVSITGLALLTYIRCNTVFTSLVQEGYYTEAQRSLYLPGRVVGQAVVNLVFVLPAICFVIIPLTTRLIKKSRLTFKRIGLYTAVGWLALSLVGWLWNLMSIIPPYSLLSFLKSTAAPILICGLPIPIAALLFFAPRMKA